MRSAILLAFLTHSLSVHLIHCSAEYAINLRKGFTAKWLSLAEVLLSQGVLIWFLNQGELAWEK